jgi:hypothetical protein
LGGSKEENIMKRKNFFTSEEDLKSAEREILRSVMPAIMQCLIEGGRVDLDRADDAEYLWSVLVENVEVVEHLSMGTVLDDQILELAKDAFDRGSITVAVILVATAVEHELNAFYRDVLEGRGALSSSETTEAIKSNLNSKIGWLLLLSTGYSLSDELKKQVGRLFELRNSVVHYKHHFSLLAGDGKDNPYYQLVDRMKEFSREELFKIPATLSAELASILSQVRPSFPLAQSMADKAMARIELSQKRGGKVVPPNTAARAGG